MKRIAKLFIGLACVSLGLTACKEDYFDPEAYQAIVKDAFPVSNISPDQDWAIFGTATATVRVNGDYGEQYRVAVYQENPLFTSPVTQLAFVTVKSGEYAQVSFTYKLSSPTVFFTCYDKLNRKVVKSVSVTGDGSIDVDFFGAAAEARTTRATEAEYEGSYAKTLNDYLNPSVTGMTTKQITVDEMKGYTAFTDDDIATDGYIFGWYVGKQQSGARRKVGEYVSGDFFYKVQAGDNPDKGSSDYLYSSNNLPVAKIVFGGTGAAAEADNSFEGYSARISRQYIVLTSLNSGANLYFQHKSRGAEGAKLCVFDLTENELIRGKYVTNEDNVYMSFTGGHSYMFYFDDNQPLTFYGFKVTCWGQVVEEPTSDDPDDPDDPTGPSKGDGHHFRVASGTTITKVFNVHAVEDNTYNDVVIYVEGKLHLKGNSLNGPTIVVGDGGEVILDTDNELKTSPARFVVMNGGKLTSTAEVTFNVTNGGPCYNAGTINMPKSTLILNGSNFYNNGTVTVDVLTGTSENTFFTNFGSITARTNSEAASAYNQGLVNACYLHFTENAGIGDFVLLNNSRIDVGGQLLITGDNTMYDRSMLNTGAIYWNNGVITGPTASGQFAVVKTAKNLISHANDLNVYNQIYFDIDVNEFYNYNNVKEDLTNEYGNAWHIVNGGSWCNGPIRYFSTETSASGTISIAASTCAGTGYNGNPNTEVDEDETITPTYRYCFEDNFPQPGDYDFNDCVMTVTPKVTDNVVELTVSLEAVGASKLLAGALRVKGVTESDISSATVAIKTGHDLDKDLTSNILTYIGNYQNSNGNTITAIRKLGENDGMTILTSDGKTSQAQNDLVIRLFNDAHWTMAGDGKSAQERLIRHFYNTMTAAISPTYPYLDVTPARSVTYTITFPNTDDGKAAAAKFGVTSNLDPFIVERHNSIFWEVHTYPFKWDQVLSAYENDTKLNSYRYADGHSGVESAIANYPWAICVPGSFLYPLEYNSICGTRTVTGNTMGTTSETYQYFSSWAEDKNSHQDWYNYPTSGMVWTGQ